MNTKDTDNMAGAVGVRDLTRRTFVAGAAVTGLAAAGAGSVLSAIPAVASEAEKTDEAVANVGAQGPIGYAHAPAASGADPIPPIEAPASWDAEADVVVVGSGIGGLTVGLDTVEKGGTAIIVEKMPITGGASRHAGGMGNLFGGSQIQNEAELSYPEFPPNLDAFIAKYESQNQWTVDIELLRALALAGGPAFDWAGEHGRQLMASPFGCVDQYLLEHGTGVMGMQGNIDDWTKMFVDAGGDLRLRTECVALVSDGDTVVGVKTVSSDGVEAYIKANKGVALCAGGIGMNRDLIAKYLPSALDGAVQGGPMPSNTGEAFRMGLGVGADVAGFDSWSCWEGAIDEETAGGDGEFWHYFWNGARQVFHNAWLIINNRGERVPYYCSGVSGFTPDPLFQMGDMQNCAAWMSQPGGKVYSICDASFAENVFSHVQSAFAVDESRVPLTEDKNLPEGHICTADWRAEFDAAVERGAVKKADTLEELADMLGLDPQAVTDAVSNFNDICAKGTDDQLVPPYDPSWLNPVAEPPFYGAIVGGQMAKTGCGLRVNPQLQVVREDGRPIPGLYANVWTAGGTIGQGNNGGVWNGNLHGGVAASFVSGWLLSQTLSA